MTKAIKITKVLGFNDLSLNITDCYNNYAVGCMRMGEVPYSYPSFYNYVSALGGLTLADYKKVTMWINTRKISLGDARKWAIEQKKHY